MQIQRVLMVEDDPQIRKVAELALTRIGKWSVAMAESGQRALEILKEEQPDVILLDVMMPEMDGPTLFRIIQDDAILCNTPIIFMTAKVQHQEVQGYYQLGAAGVIQKPFDPLQLPTEINSIVKGAAA